MIFAHNADKNGYRLLRSRTHEVMAPLNKWVRTGTGLRPITPTLCSLEESEKQISRSSSDS
jgi:hypothetical protein